MTPQELLLSVLKRMDGGRAWVKGMTRHPRKDKSDMVCLLAALSEVGPMESAERHAAQDALRQTVDRLFPDRMPRGWRNLAAFNDHPATTWDDMERTLTEAAR